MGAFLSMPAFAVICFVVFCCIWVYYHLIRRTRGTEIPRNRQGTQAVTLLIRRLGHKDLGVREAAIDALEEIGKPAIPKVIAALQAPHALTKYGAAELLGRLGDPAGIEPLVQLFRSTDWIAHDTAIEALARIGAPAIEAFQRILEAPQTTPEMRQEIQRAMEGIPLNTVVLGDAHWETDDSHSTLRNPDVSTLTLPMPQLQQLRIDCATCDVYRVEQFLTYAVNYIGQKRLKNGVKVYLLGDTGCLSPILLNSLHNLFNSVIQL
jgi:hypothetical protein